MRRGRRHPQHGGPPRHPLLSSEARRALRVPKSRPCWSSGMKASCVTICSSSWCGGATGGRPARPARRSSTATTPAARPAMWNCGARNANNPCTLRTSTCCPVLALTRDLDRQLDRHRRIPWDGRLPRGRARCPFPSVAPASPNPRPPASASPQREGRRASTAALGAPGARGSPNHLTEGDDRKSRIRAVYAANEDVLRAGPCHCSEDGLSISPRLSSSRSRAS